MGAASSIDGKYNNQSPGSVSVQNADNEPTPGLSIADASSVEQDSGTSTLELTVSLDYASESVVSVNWATSNASATAGSDYTAASGVLTFSPLDQEETITVTIAGDFSDEGDETRLSHLLTEEGNHP